MGTVTSNCPPPMPFDPDLALRFLKWRAQKRSGAGGWRGKYPVERLFGEVVESIMSKAEAIERHHPAEKRAEGWSEDETGNLIPPGWVRTDPVPAEGEADEPPSPEAFAGQGGAGSRTKSGMTVWEGAIALSPAT